MSDRVDILLAAYNGERFLAEQIESILAQDYDNIRLYISDDGSRDRTADIAKHYADRETGRIIFTQNSKNSGSATANFFNLLHKSTAPYVMFCDQDDVWFKDKVSTSIAALKRAEAAYGAEMPLLLHTDLTVADENLNVTAKSMFKLQHLDSGSVTVRKLAVQNVVTGCTMALNRSLADRLKYTPRSVPVHDWWIALYTACCGKIIFVDKPTLLYRQHGRNVCGAQDMSNPAYMLERAGQLERSRLMVSYGYKQAAEMAEMCAEEIGEENQKLLSGFGKLQNQGYLKKLSFVSKNKLWKDGLVRKLGQLIFL